MSIWAISDIHASATDPSSGCPSKPMDVFGPVWANHMERLESEWIRVVRPADTVLIGGDTDWSLRLEDAKETLLKIGSWSGDKILIRGNHDYWWSSKSTNRVRKMLPPSMSLLHNNSFEVEGFNVCGAKGSPVPGGIDWTAQNAKLLNREMQRLQLSLDARSRNLPTIIVIHYPPFYPSHNSSPYRHSLEQHEVVACLYGHLHGDAGASGPVGRYENIEYRLIAGDANQFRPIHVASDGELVVAQQDPVWRQQMTENALPHEDLKGLAERARADNREEVGDDRRAEELWDVPAESQSQLVEQQEEGNR